MIVAKFGGSSLANASQTKKVLEIIRSNPERRVIVVSAPGKRDPNDVKVTDQLEVLYRQIRNNVDVSTMALAIGERYEAIAEGLDLGIDMRMEFGLAFGAMRKDPTLDLVLSYGEYLEAKLIACALGYRFIDARECIRFGSDGELLNTATNELIQAVVRKGRVVIPGFYGASSDYRVKTFSRGGSDLTGALVARALKADVYENWTDVSGLKMADPRLVENPRAMRFVSHAEMRELAYMGANVFHAEAMFPVAEAGIPTRILNTNEPDDPGTLITSDVAALGEPPPIVGVAGRKGFVAITIEQVLMDKEIGFARRILSVLEEEGVGFEHMPGGVDYITLTIDTRFVREDALKRVKMKLAEVLPKAQITMRRIAHVVVVGRGMVDRPGILAQAAEGLKRGRVSVLTVNQGVPQTSITFGVAEGDCATAVKALYDAFVR